MKKINKFIEIKLADLGGVIAAYPLRFILAVLVVVVLIASNLPKITVDTSTEGFLHETSQSRLDYDAFRNQFGRDEKVVVAIKTEGVFQLDTLAKIKKLHDELAQNVPYLFDISSIINARNTIGEGDSLLVDDLLSKWPTTQAEADGIKALAMANPMLENILLSQDGQFTVIVLESNTYSSLTNQKEAVGLDDASQLEDELSGFDDEFSDLNDELSGFDETTSQGNNGDTRPFITDKENTEMVNAVSDIVAKYQADDFTLYVAGSPSVTAFLKEAMMSDMQKFVLMILLATAILLALLFRRASGVILPLLTVGLAVISTMGLMALNGTPIKVMTQVLPSFLLAVGVGASIHVLAIFYKKFDETGDKEAAIRYTLSHSGLAIIMTSLTTAAGMASFIPSEVAPVADLGLFAAAGVMIALLFTLILLPALLMQFQIKQRPVDESQEHHDFLDKFLKQVAHFSQNHAKKIVIFSITFMVVAIGFASKITYSHNPLLWLPEGHETRIATEVIDHELRGSISIELIVDTGVENGVYDLSLLQAVERITTELNTIDTEAYFVGKAVSVVDVIKEIHKALNHNSPEFYALPTDPDLISQEILLFENSGSDDLEDFVDTPFSMARITVKVPWIDAFKYHDLLQQVASLLEKELGQDSQLSPEIKQHIKVTTTGMIPLLAETSAAAITSSGVSYLIAFIIIALMLIALLSSVKLGLLSMIPNLLPIFFVLAVMVLFQFPLDLFTMLIGVIVMGIAVDDIVHFMHNFRRYHLQGMPTRQAVEKTLTSTGRAMIMTTVVLFIGFMLYLFSSMTNLFLFGLLTAIAFVMALLAVFLLAPALMALVYPDKTLQEERSK
ncbi:MAG: efflux RND transporter permease subunit [Thiomicrorhabdus sp.]|nr:efflux RND transporter permease subunit [Thiomicrorhabdus sp.]